MKKIVIIILLAVSSLALYAQSGESSDLSYGIKLYNDKIYDVAITQFSSFLEKYAASLQAPQAQYYLASAYIEQKDMDNGLKNLQKVILNYPKSEYCEKAIGRIAEIYNRQKEYDKAARYYLQLKNYFPSSTLIPEYTFKALELFYKVKNYDEIKEVAALLKKKYPNNPYSRKSELIQAKVHIAEKDVILGERIYTEILRTAAEADVRSACLYDYGMFQLAGNNISGARARFKEIIDKYNKEAAYIPAVFEYCRLLTDEKKFDEAATVLKSIKSVPEQYAAEISAVKGENEYFRGNFSAAATEFENSLRIRKNFPVIFQTAYCYEGQGLSEKAAGYLLNSLKKDTTGITPDLKKAALLRSAEFYIKAGKLAQGTAAYQSYLTAFPEDREENRIRFLMAKTYFDNRRFEDAYDLFSDYLRNVKNSFYDDDATYLAGESALESGNYKTALKMYKSIASDFPASRYLPLALNRISLIENYKLQSPDAISKMARLTANSIDAKDKTGIWAEWARFSFHDLKDYKEAIVYAEKHLAKNPAGDPEINYIHAASLEMQNGATAEDNQKALTIYSSILNSGEKNRWTVKALTGKIRLLAKITPEGWQSERLALLKNAADNHIDDENGTLLLEYCKQLLENNDNDNAVKYIEIFNAKNPASLFADELIFAKAAILEKKGDYAQSLKIYREVTQSRKSSVYRLQAIKKLILLSNDPVETKLTYFELIATAFGYTEDAENIEEQTAAFYAANDNRQKALDIYLNLQRLLDNQSINARWNFQSRNYSKQIADLYYGQNKFDKAEFYYKRELSRASDLDRAEILKKLNTIYKQSGNSAALEYNLKAMSTLSGSSTGLEADIALADIEFEKENYEKSLGQYAKILNNPSIKERANLEVRYIQNLFRLKKFAEGEEKLKVFRINYKENYDKNSWEPVFYLEKANYFLAIKDYDKATKAYEALIDDYEKSDLVPAAMYGHGRVLFDNGKKDKAFEMWKEIIKKYPDNPISIETNYNLGAIYLEREMMEDAVGALQGVVKYPKDHRLKKYAYKYLIDVYRKTGLTDAAGKAIREYIALYPDEEDVFQKRIEIGNLYQANEEFDQALDYFSRLLNEAKGEDEASVQFYIGETYRLKKDFRQAIKEFLKVKYLIKSNAPQDWCATASYNAALCYEELQENDKAIALLQEIVDKYGQAHKYGKQAQRVIERIKN